MGRGNGGKGEILNFRQLKNARVGKCAKFFKSCSQTAQKGF